jgi:hypothetical protein
VDGRRVAGAEDLTDDLEAGLQVEAGAHDDVVDAGMGERGPHLVDSGGDVQLDVGQPQLPLGVLDDHAQAPEQEHVPGHAHPPGLDASGPNDASVPRAPSLPCRLHVRNI